MTRVAPETERETVDRLVQRTVFTPVRGAGAVAETVARLGEAIGLGLLKPGDRLPSEMQLASALGISAVSLRSALVVLRSAGLIETRRGRGGGTFITPGAAQALLPEAEAPEAHELEDLATERAVVEGGAAALAAERALNARLQGGCQVPIAGPATVVGETLEIEGLVASLDGRQVIRAVRRGRREDAATLGVAVGDALLADGAAALLAAIGAH